MSKFFPATQLSIALALIAGLSGSVRAQESPNEPWFLGDSFDQIPDIDGDRVADFVVLYDRVPIKTAHGRWNSSWQVLGVSGKNGEILWRWSRPDEAARWSNTVVRAWMDWNNDGTNDVLVWWCPNSKPGLAKWRATILCGKSGVVLNSQPMNFDVQPSAIALTSVQGEPGAPSTKQSALLLERQLARKPTDLGVSKETGVGNEWERARVWRADSKGFEVIGEFEPPDGSVFCGRPVWIQRGSSGDVWGVVFLSKLPDKEWSRLHLARVSFGAKDQFKLSWLGVAQAKCNSYANLTAAEVGDVNGDGFSDVAVAAMKLRSQARVGGVLVLSGANGRLLKELVDHGEGVESFGCDGPEGWGCEFATSMACVGDLDEDGCDEIVVSSPAAELSGGVVILYNLRTGTAVETPRTGESMNYRRGSQVVAGFDYDADGTPDFVARESWYNNGSDCGPRLFIYSGRSLELLRKFPPVPEKQ